jgi:hypothetical protein
VGSVIKAGSDTVGSVTKTVSDAVADPVGTVDDAVSDTVGKVQDGLGTTTGSQRCFSWRSQCRPACPRSGRWPHLRHVGHAFAVRAPGTATGGQFGLFEWNMQPRTRGADGHFHRTFSESFYVTSGTVQFYDGNRWM